MVRVPVPAGSGPSLNPYPSNNLQPVDQTAGTRQFGEALQSTGEFVQKYADEQARLDDQVDMIAARNADTEDAKWLREQLWSGTDPYFKKQGINAMNARAPLEEALRKRREEVGSTLKTDRQRNYYRRMADARFNTELEGISRYAITQTAKEEERGQLSALTEATNDFVTNWNDPDRRALAEDTGIGIVRKLAQTQGWDPQTLVRAEKDFRSTAYGKVIGSLLDGGEVERAHAFFEDNKERLDPDVRSAMTARLYKPLMARQAEGITDDVFGTLPAPQSQQVEAERTGAVIPRMQAITGFAESRNREYNADGSRVTSPKGARGLMQVMPATAGDPGYGLKASNGTPADDARLGREYLAKMMQVYGNDPAKAWAAYNWGPGNLDKAIKARGSNWLAAAPQETRDYVNANLAALGGRGTGNTAQQAPKEHDLNALLADVDRRNLPFDLREEVKRRVIERVRIDEGLLGRQREDAEEDAWKTINGLGTNGFTNINQLPSSVRNRLSPKQVASFGEIAERNLRSNSAGKTDWTAYGRYSDLFATDAEGFLAVPQSELRAKLGDSEFEQAMGWRRALLAGKGAAKPDVQVTHERIRSVTDPLLSAAGIMKPPEGAGLRKDQAREAYAKRTGQFQWAVAYDVEHWQKAHPNQPVTDNVVRDIANSLLIRMWEKGEGDKREFRGFAFEVEPAKGITADMPRATADDIRRRYKQRWGYEPSQSQVWEIYRYGARGGRQ